MSAGCYNRNDTMSSTADSYDFPDDVSATSRSAVHSSGYNCATCSGLPCQRIENGWGKLREWNFKLYIHSF